MAARRPRAGVWWRAGQIVFGILVVIFGIIDLPLPGPGTVFICIGLLILAPHWRPVRRLLAAAFRRWPKVRRAIPAKHRRFARRDEPDEPDEAGSGAP